MTPRGASCCRNISTRARTPRPSATSSASPRRSTQGAGVSRILVANRAYETACRLTDEFVADDQADNFAAQGNAANLSAQAERYDDAVKYYTRANKLKPEDYGTLVALGNTLFDAERLPEAEKWYAAALAKRADDVNVRTDLGLTFLLREPAQYDRAVEEFRRSLAEEPAHPQTLQNLTVAYTRKGELTAAEGTLARLAAVAPQSPTVEQLRAGIDKARASAPAETSAVKAEK